MSALESLCPRSACALKARHLAEQLAVGRRVVVTRDEVEPVHSVDAQGERSAT